MGSLLLQIRISDHPFKQRLNIAAGGRHIVLWPDRLGSYNDIPFVMQNPTCDQKRGNTIFLFVHYILMLAYV